MGQWINIKSQKGQLERNWLAQQQKLLETEKIALSKTLHQAKLSKSDVDDKRLALIKRKTSS
ncbi:MULTISPECIES: hypothetical protein [unclassified Pseudoalteromonas]|uniref:hypothetical protein n=1 Tax=unclassified Pseudoalteromonas TaxID=194690 RepID=UPI0005A9458B|nr:MULTISPECIES: hypothetical protein [unclassified Pseudoalteromonas]